MKKTIISAALAAITAHRDRQRHHGSRRRHDSTAVGLLRRPPTRPRSGSWHRLRRRRLDRRRHPRRLLAWLPGQRRRNIDPVRPGLRVLQPGGQQHARARRLVRQQQDPHPHRSDDRRGSSSPAPATRPTARSRSSRPRPSSRAACTTATTSRSKAATPGCTSRTVRPSGWSAHPSQALPSRRTILLRSGD